jgi:nitrogenase molybdenum-iron protein alpha/beta subunit
MNCAWCNANADGSDSHGICSACMTSVFGVDPDALRKEIAEEEELEQIAA